MRVTSARPASAKMRKNPGSNLNGAGDMDSTNKTAVAPPLCASRMTLSCEMNCIDNAPLPYRHVDIRPKLQHGEVHIARGRFECAGM
jgi:hypothetical protein